MGNLVEPILVSVWPSLRVFFEIHKVGNIGIKDLCEDNKNTFSKKYLQWGMNSGPPPFQSDVLLSELTWQVLVQG